MLNLFFFSLLSFVFLCPSQFNRFQFIFVASNTIRFAALYFLVNSWIVQCDKKGIRNPVNLFYSSPKCVVKCLTVSWNSIFVCTMWLNCMSIRLRVYTYIAIKVIMLIFILLIFILFKLAIVVAGSKEKLWETALMFAPCRMFLLYYSTKNKFKNMINK